MAPNSHTQSLIDALLAIPEQERAQALVDFISAVVTANQDPDGLWDQIDGRVLEHLRQRRSN